MKKEKVLHGTIHNICLFCGKELKEKLFGYRYIEYYCDCDESKLDGEINSKIISLQSQRPKHKYQIVKTDVLIER